MFKWTGNMQHLLKTRKHREIGQNIVKTYYKLSQSSMDHIVSLTFSSESTTGSSPIWEASRNLMQIKISDTSISVNSC